MVPKIKVQEQGHGAYLLFLPRADFGGRRTGGDRRKGVGERLNEEEGGEVRRREKREGEDGKGGEDQEGKDEARGKKGVGMGRHSQH